MAKKMDLDDGKTGGSRGERTPGVQELVEVFTFPEKKWVSIRLMPGLFSTAGYWIQTKKRDGAKGKFPAVCPSYDPEAQERDSTIPDPWRDLAEAQRAKMSEEDRKDRDKQLIQFTQNWWMQAIIRSVQKTLPDRMPKPTASERKSGLKEKDSDSLTAKKAIKMGRSLLGKIQELKGLNTIETKSGAVKAFSVNDEKFGRDIKVYYDSKKAPADQYQVQLGDKRTPITQEEAAMLNQDLDGACAVPEVDHAAIAADFQQWAAKMGIKTGGKKSKKDVDEDEDFDDEDDEDDEDEPKSKKGKAGKGKPAKGKGKKPKDEDEDDDFDDEDDSDDEDDEPKSKKGKSASKGKKPKDEDEDDDFDDEDDEDDEPPKKAKGKGKPTKAKKSKDEDEDDEDDFGDDDEDDEPPKKGKPVKGKGKKPKDEDEDDDFDDEDDEDDEDDSDDEDDEPPKKAKGKKGKASKPAKGKKSKDEDEDEDDEDF